MAETRAPLTDRRRLRFALAAYALSFIPSAVLPWTISSLAADGMSIALAGQLASIQLAVLAVFAVGGSLIVHRLPRSAVLITSAFVMIAASILLLLTPESFGMLIILMALIAAGAGLASAIGSGVLARADDGDRMSAHVWTGSLIWQAILWQVTPIVVTRFGAEGIYLMIAVAGVLLCLLIPGYRESSAEGAARTSEAPGARRPSSRALPIVAIMVVLAAFGFWYRDSLAWSLADLRAMALQVDGAKLSITLLIASVLAIPAPSVASWAGRRFGKGAPLIVGMVLVAIVMIGIASSTTGQAYLGFYSMWTFTSMFAWTFLVQFSVAADPAGRIAALTGSMVFVGAAVGPFTGTLLMGDGSSQTMVMLGVAALSAVTLACAIGLTATLRRHSKASASRPGGAGQPTSSSSRS